MFLLTGLFNLIKKLFKVIFFLIIALIIVLYLAGCEAKTVEPTAVAVLVGNHANSQELPLQADEATELITKVAETFGAVSLIIVDGDPYCETELEINTPSKSGLSDNKLRQIATEQTTLIQQLLYQASAVTPEVDTLAAIRLAARTLQDNQSEVKHIVIFDTGLSTTGSLNFKNNLIESDAQVLCEQLADMSAIPDLTGISVVWFGLGDTEAPQADLSPKQLENLRNIWKAVLTSANANSVYFSGALSVSALTEKDLPYVSPVPLLAEPDIEASVPSVPETIVFNEDRVAFVGDSCKFINKEAAIKTLQPVAEYMMNHSDFKALLVGTTATFLADPDYCIKLSQKRADTVRDTLIELGVNPLQLQTIGLGYEDPWHVEDLNPDGTQNANAGVNRKVVFISENSEFYTLLGE